MLKLKGTEKFVAESLQVYFAKLYSNVYFEKGNDPPDIYLKINGRKIAVEITDIDQNVLKNRRTIDYGYLSFIDNLDEEFCSLIDNDKMLLLFFYHNYIKVSTISKKFKKYLKSLIKTIEIGNKIEDNINAVGFEISILPMQKNDTKKIVGSAMPFGGKFKEYKDTNSVCEMISDCNLSVQAFNIVTNRIFNKNIKCKNIEKPIWLALFDNHYKKFTYFDNDDHIEHYKNVIKEIKDFGIFEKVLIIFQNRDVLEFNT